MIYDEKTYCCFVPAAYVYTFGYSFCCCKTITKYKPGVSFGFYFYASIAGCINVYNGDSYPNIAKPWFRVNNFLNENGYGTTASKYYQNTYLVLLDSDEWAKGKTTVATNALQTGTSVGTTKYFTYTSGYGPSSVKYVTIAGYPVHYNFSKAYGISFSWLV